MAIIQNTIKNGGSMSGGIINISINHAIMNPDDLPGELSSIAEIVGVEKALEYAEKMGGVTLYFVRWLDDPEKWNEDTVDLVDTFGVGHAKEIISLLAPGSITIPNCKRLLATQKHKRVIADRESGMSVKAVARKYRMHERMVRRITQSARQELEQNQMALL